MCHRLHSAHRCDRRICGIVVNTLLGFSDEFVALAEHGGPRRTGFGAGGRFASQDAVGAHGAFLHFGKQLAPFVLGNAEGASSHAIATSHATRFFINDGALRRFAKSGNGTYGSTRGIGAIHAKTPHVLFALGEYNRIFVFGLAIFGGDRVVVGEFIFVGARLSRIACS